MTDSDTAHRPNLAGGIAVGTVQPGGMVLGRVGDEDVLLARTADEFFAVGAHCTHYHGALADGLVVGDTVRCPLHHACFSLRSGEALRAPALDPIACWRVERQGDTVFVQREAAGTDTIVACAATRTGVHHHHRWRRRRAGGSRHASPRGLRRSDHDDQRGRRTAERSTELVEGLSGRSGARRLDSAASARVLRRAADRTVTRLTCLVARRQGPTGCSSRVGHDGPSVHS